MEEKLTVAEVRQVARKRLTKNALNYYESGADYEQTLSENCRAYDRLLVRQHRVVNDISKGPINLETNVLGKKLNIPIFIAPTAMQKMAHPDGEVCTAQAASSFNTYMVVSTFSTTSYEELVQSVPSALYWMQLYIYKDRRLSETLIRRAERVGFKALVLTVDTPILGRRIADVKEKFKLPPPLQLANYSDFQTMSVVSSKETSGLMAYIANNIETKLSWNDLEWIRTITKLPILLKGILRKEDAVECLKHDVQGIIVSNHGGRQLDGVPATIEALPEVVRAVQGKIPVFVDGGIRRGSDVFKALALGAQAVFIGRPVLYGLAYGGTEGVKKVLGTLVKELRETMQQTGCQNVQDICQFHVCHESQYGRFSTSYTYQWNWDLTPNNPVCIEDFKQELQEKSVYVDEEKERSMSESFLRLRLRPYRMRGIDASKTATEVLGISMSLPVIMDLSGDTDSYIMEAMSVAKSVGTCIEISKTYSGESNYLLHIMSSNKNMLLSLLEESTRCRGVTIDITDITSLPGFMVRIRSVTNLPVIVKGVMTKEQAIHCLRNNVQGIVVSVPCGNSSDLNSIDVLGVVARAVNYMLPVFLEGGIRKGTDILKALSLGASAVFVKRPIEWGHAHQGKQGIENVMAIFEDEFQRAMLLAGCENTNEINSSLVVDESYYWNLVSEREAKL